MTPIDENKHSESIFQKLNKRLPYLNWLIFSSALIVLPLIFSSRSAVSTLCYLGIMSIFVLSYNVLLGQTGLLSLGHGLYMGLGGFFTIYVFNMFLDRGIEFPLPFIPIFGGVGALIIGVFYSWISAARGGMTFAMITLGLAELTHALSYILPSFFGGEEGKSIDRMDMGSFLGYDFGSQTEIYYIIAIWLFISALILYFISKTPFGMLTNAVRENSERVEFIGFKPARIRFSASIVAAFFAGIAGGLSAITFEIVSIVDLGATQSTLVLLMTYIGGIQQFFGPILGAVVIGIMKLWLSDVTSAWMLYFGLLFIFVIMYAPRGLIGIVTDFAKIFHTGELAQLFKYWAFVGSSGMALAIAVGALVEMSYRIGLDKAQGSVLSYMGLSIDVSSIWQWVLVFVLIILGFIITKKSLSILNNRRHEWQLVTNGRLQENEGAEK